MKENLLEKSARILRCALLASGFAYVTTYLILAVLRIKYPFELEWLEGSLLIHARRILSGQKIYVEPSFEFVPFFYTPIYFYLSAAVSYVFGPGFLPLRLISVISSFGSFGIIFLFVKKETNDGFSAALAACLFAATFRISGIWFDLARVDSLFLFLLLAGLYLIKFKKTTASYVFAGILLSLSFLTKQTALAVSLPVMIYCLFLDRKRAAFFIGTIVGIVGISTLVMNSLHDGWYSYYIFGIPAGHPLLKEMIIHFWNADLLAPLAIACSATVFYFCTHLTHSKKWDWLYYFMMSGGMVGAAWMSRIHEGGYDNVLLTAYAAVAILFGLGLNAILEIIQASGGDRRRFYEICVYIICLLQFACLIYNPLLMIPTAADKEAGEKLVELVRQIDGEVYVPFHAYLAARAGKKTYANAEAMYTIMSGDKKEYRMKLIRETELALRRKKFSALLLDMHESRQIWQRGVGGPGFDNYCFSPTPVFTDGSSFWPITGVQVRPEILLYRCSDMPNAGGAQRKIPDQPLFPTN